MAALDELKVLDRPVRPHAADEPVVVLRRGTAVDVGDEVDVLRRVMQHGLGREKPLHHDQLRRAGRRRGRRRWYRGGGGGRPSRSRIGHRGRVRRGWCTVRALETCGAEGGDGGADDGRSHWWSSTMATTLVLRCVSLW